VVEYVESVKADDGTGSERLGRRGVISVTTRDCVGVGDWDLESAGESAGEEGAEGSSWR